MRRDESSVYIGKRDPATTIRLARERWREASDMSDALRGLPWLSAYWHELRFVYYALTDTRARSEEELRAELAELELFTVAEENSGARVHLSNDRGDPTLGEVLDFLIADDGLANGHATSVRVREAANM